jgi:nitroimidazol reductase NimA-like FMN-containing flavoprotein (pyridoxamine 5'-phosphate oxidase superfamily)
MYLYRHRKPHTLQRVNPLVSNLFKASEMIRDLSEQRIKKILESNFVGSLGFIAQKSPYVLPVTYYFDPQHNQIISYAMEGHKIEAMREHPQVSLMVYEQDSMTSWRSVLIHGVYEELHQIDAKFYLKEFSQGIQKLLVPKSKGDTRFIEDFSSRAETGGIPIVYRIRIVDWSGKFREE